METMVVAPQPLNLSFKSARSQSRCSPSRSRIPPTSSSSAETTKAEDDFAFDYREDLGRTSLSAEELFHGGKIRSLHPQGSENGETMSSPKIPRSSALENGPKKTGLERGRVRVPQAVNRTSRSLSPIRILTYPWEIVGDEGDDKRDKASFWTKGSNSKRWKLRDLLLFRSSSEGRATTEHALMKCSVLFKWHGDGIKNSTGSRSSDSRSEYARIGSRRSHVSAHELHYTVNRSVTEDLKKRTFLPYKQGILFFNGF